MTEALTPVPFTILTGYLGAGKTTVLNRLLRRPLGRRVAVLVNELGRVAIDGRLIEQAGGDVLELAGGCVCCKVDVKNDLWDGIADVVARSRPDHVILETTGIAEPPALLEGLTRPAGVPLDPLRSRTVGNLPEPLASAITPAGVVCVVDAETCAQVMERRDEARVQVACADRLILTKLDRAAAGDVARAHALLAAMNSGAERASFPATPDGDRALSVFLLAARSPARPPADPAPHRHGQLACACFSDPAPLLPGPLLAAVEELRPRLVRVKGFVHLADDPRRAFLELAGTELSLRPGDPWSAGERRHTELVFIGDDLDDDRLARRLWACRSPAADSI